MTTPLLSLCSLPDRTLVDLVSALRVGRMPASASAYQIRHAVPAITETAAHQLADLLGTGLLVRHAVTLLDAIATERQRADASIVELVTSGPDVVGETRDTGVVLRKLFSSAASRVLVVGFAVYQGKQVFAELADRMETRRELRVRLCLDIARRPGDTANQAGILSRFRLRFLKHEWPGRRLPEVYYDPRALAQYDGPRASLHAKCVVVDGETAFVGSANLTEAAQARNIEVGLLVRSSSIATSVERHFDGLIARDCMIRLFLR